MKSKEGVVWCWKEHSPKTIFIFRDGYQEIEICLMDIQSEMWFTRNEMYLLPDEKTLIRQLIWAKQPE